MMRRRLPDFAVSSPDQHSCSICFINEHQCKGTNLLDITEIIDGEKSCLDKIQEMMHVEIVLGYSTVCISCASEINKAYLLQEKIMDAVKFWKKYFGYEESSDLNMVTDVIADDVSIEQKECDVSINTIPKFEKIEVEEETDDDDNDDNTLMGERDSDKDPLDYSKDSNSDNTLPDIKNKVKKKNYNTSKQMKSKILEDLTTKTVTLIPKASIENITGAAIKNISNVTEEEKKEKSDNKQSTLFCGKCNYYYHDISEIMTHSCSRRKSNNQERKIAEKQPTRKEPKPIDCYGCAACGKIFKRRIDLKRHQKYQHAVIMKLRLDCDACGEEFESKIDLSEHIRDVHSVTECFGCAACGKMFETKIDLDRHQKDEHSSSLESAVCNICDKSFTNEALLKLHNSVHTGEHNYCCDVCGQTFRSRGSIYKHLRMHTLGGYNRGKPFLCTICGKLFPNSSQMSRHKMWHAGVKNYECKICNKKFSRTHHLTVHLRSHTGEKPYSCQFCSQAFSEKASLRKHIFAKHA